MSAVLSVRVDEDSKTRLERLADTSGRSVGFYIRELIDEHLAELEFVSDLEREARLAAAGKLKTISWESLQRECGLED